MTIGEQLRIGTQSLMLNLMLTFPKNTNSHFLSGYIRRWYGTIQYKKLEFFLGKMAGKDGKVSFCYISISYLKIEIGQVLTPLQGAGLIRFYYGNR